MTPSSRRAFFWAEVGMGVLLIGLAIMAVNPRITTWVAADGFRNMLDKETSKGMKFEADYAPLTRVGVLGMHTDSFKGTNGQKTIVSMDAHDISGWFNPMGIGLRRWQIDDLHIKSGTVMIQKTDPKPGEPKGASPIPWWAIFWPYRVHLEDVKVDDADVLFNLSEKESGIYHTFLEITPNGRDFEYDGRGGVFKTPMSPTLGLKHVHLLIRKPRLYCPVFEMGDDAKHPEAQLKIHGDAGLQDDRSIHIFLKMAALPISSWVPEKYRDNVVGNANGDFEYKSTSTGLETAEGKGAVEIVDAVLQSLPAVKQYVNLTKSPDPGDLHLKTCKTDVVWEKGALTLQNLQIECPGVFEVSGTVTMAKDKTLSGTLEVGLTAPYIAWLPTAQTTVFTKTDGQYHTTTVQISGTSKKPVQDLSPRIVKQIGPLLAVKLFFNAL